jgi:hypothetical protein
VFVSTQIYILPSGLYGNCKDHLDFLNLLQNHVFITYNVNIINLDDLISS